MKQPTQNERILELLADGGWHTTRELLLAVPCIVHSRISELRGRGHLIEHQGGRGGAEHNRYRLLSVPLVEAGPNPSSVDHGSGPASTSGIGDEGTDGMPHVDAAQLTLEIAA